MKRFVSLRFGVWSGLLAFCSLAFIADGEIFVGKWGSKGSGDGQFNYPGCVALDSLGNVYVADTWNHRIQKFTSEGVFLKKWGSQGSGDGELYCPWALL